jgi:WD40 repeat protein
VSALAFSPNADALATGDSNGTIQLWSPAGFHLASAPLAIGAVGLPAAGHAPAVLSADARILADRDGHGTVRVWDVTTQRLVGVLLPGHGALTGLALSPDGGTLAVAGDGVQLWRTSAGQRIGTALPASGSKGGYGGVAFSPDGTTLATIGADGTVRLWNVATQQEIGAPMTADTQPVYAAAFSPDGTTLATAGGDGIILTWDVAFPAKLAQAACAIADVSLTREQWADYAGTQPFQQVCPTS